MTNKTRKIRKVRKHTSVWYDAILSCGHVARPFIFMRAKQKPKKGDVVICDTCNRKYLQQPEINHSL